MRYVDTHSRRTTNIHGGCTVYSCVTGIPFSFVDSFCFYTFRPVLLALLELLTLNMISFPFEGDDVPPALSYLRDIDNYVHRD